MREFSLSKELTHKLARDFGFSLQTFGNRGVTHPDLLTDIVINIQEDDGIRKAPVWYGESKGDENIICALLCALNTTSDELEIVCVIGFKNLKGEFQSEEMILSIHYDWNDPDDFGLITMKLVDKWVPISLAQRLQLVLGSEIFIQSGNLWQSSKNIPDQLKKDLASVIDVDSSDQG